MSYTVQMVFNKFGEEYLEKYNPSYEQKQVFNQIISCRTEKLGTRIYQCENCGEQIFTYNSCRDRHCPNCQNYRKEVWIENRKNDIINTSYFHVVMTIPVELRPIFYHNQKECYNLLFKCSAETIKELCKDSKYLGAEVGITIMLHTWSQKGNYHPHTHIIVTGGGIDSLGRWKTCKDNYFLPVKVISRKFRGKLIANLKQTELKFYNNLEYLNDKDELNKYLDTLYKKEWVCYCKEPFNNVGETYKYLGRYAFKVCISNERIVNIDDRYVYFSYKDRRDDNKEKVMKMKGEEFIRQFLQHVLPKSFIKVRYYGIMAGKNKTENLKKVKLLTKTKEIKEKLLTKLEILNKMIGRDVTKCQKCNGNLIIIHTERPKKPPDEVKKYIESRTNA